MTNLFTNDTPWLMIRPIQPWQTIKFLPPWETIAVMHHHNHLSHTTLDETLPSCVLHKPSHPNHLWQNISPIPAMFNHFTHSTHDKLFQSCYPWKTTVSSYLMTNKSIYATLKNLCNHIPPWQSISPKLPITNCCPYLLTTSHYTNTTLTNYKANSTMINHFTSATCDKPFYPWQMIKPIPPWQTISPMLRKTNHCTIVPHDKQVHVCYCEKPWQSWYSEKLLQRRHHHDSFHSCHNDKPSHKVHLRWTVSLIPPIKSHLIPAINDKPFHLCFP